MEVSGLNISAKSVDMSDISGRIKLTEKKFRLLFNNPNDVIWLMDLSSWRFLYVSREIKDILGYTPEEFMEKTPKDVCTPECLERVMPVFEEVKATFQEGVHRTIHIKTDFITNEGALLSAEVDWRPFKDGEGLKGIGILRSPKQVSELQSLGDDLEAQLKEVIEERDRLRWEVKILEGLLPICASCKRIRDENGNWQMLEKYLSDHSEAELTHSICPKCKDRLYPDL